jgi:hypothetical protein
MVIAQQSFMILADTLLSPDIAAMGKSTAFFLNPHR